MKKHLILMSLLLTSSLLNAQILVPANASPGIQGSNAFLDATTSYSNESGAQANIGKGLIFPSVDLVNFVFDLTLADGFTFPSYFDGMVVYNTATGNTLISDNDNNGVVTAVTPGFYYFSNPNGAANGNLTSGVWTAMGGGATATAKDVTPTEVALSIKINGAQLYAIKGSFIASGTSPSISITVPTGMTGYYSMVIYQGGKTIRREIYSFNTAISLNNVICGNGIFSEVLPAGTYDYVLEYFK